MRLNGVGKRGPASTTATSTKDPDRLR
eukprot:COSAG05_NODE_8066_length_739_cov_1.901563_2_plen_26_part_01